MLTLSPRTARRLAITRQHLAAPQPPPDSLLAVIRDLGCLQLDPISAVARSHQLVLWSRFGQYDRAQLDHLLWETRELFEYWAHAASIVLTEDYPIHADMMAHYGSSDSNWHRSFRDWMVENASLRDHILHELEQRGPLSSKDFEDKSTTSWHSTGWTSGRNISRMLDSLWTQGEILVHHRQGGTRCWHLAERCLPPWTPREKLPRHEVVQRGALRAVRALGIARPGHIKAHFIRNRYTDLPAALKKLEADGQIVRARIDAQGKGWSGDWYVAAADLPLIESLDAGNWQPRTTLLSPFDNLIADRARTRLLFDFDYTIEIYVPKAKRRYGYYVLPILHGDRLIGRLDPQLDRKTGVLNINAIYAEPDAPDDSATAQAVRSAIEDLAAFSGAQSLAYHGPLPDIWRQTLLA